MEKFSKEQIKNYAYEILKDFDAFCKRNNLKYFLDYGTLLGAVRHKGFIPWDDDVDISMPRKDYEAFLKLWPQDLSVNKSYEIISPYKNNKLLYRRSKIADNRTEMIEYNEKRPAVFIDIFVIDGIMGGVNDYNASLKTVNRLVTIYELCNAGVYGTGFSKLFKSGLYFAFSLFGKEKVKNIISQKLDQKYSFYSCDYVAVFGDGYYGREMQPRDIFEVIYLKFETILCSAPKGYDARLKKMYGDYMVPVPSPSHGHTYDMYMKDEVKIE